MSDAIPIFLYHRIDDSGDMYVTPPAEFERQLEWLHGRGWKSLSAEEFAAIAEGKKCVTPGSFMITFDDGYESIRSTALGILQKFDFNALCFISTNLVEKSPDTAISLRPELDRSLYLSWPQIRELQSSGLVDCQSHSHTHGKFLNFSQTEIEEDLGTSVDILAYQLRISPRHFTHLAWPWGVSLAAWREAATRIGFRLQYGVARQAYRPGAALDQIPRCCFDDHQFGRFQRELWLQTGRFSSLWDAVYPYGKKARRLWKIVRRQAAS